MLKLERLLVLVVDDDEVVRKIIVEHMQGFGFKNFIEAKDGAEAYRYIQDPLQRLDLVLCDWEMPRTDGLTLLRALRANKTKSDVPFIMITSQQSQERMKISKAKVHEVSSYIVKPFRGEVLKEKVFSVLLEYEKNKYKAV
jgi:CheY-like chemotaxis protein